MARSGGNNNRAGSGCTLEMLCLRPFRSMPFFVNPSHNAGQSEMSLDPGAAPLIEKRFRAATSYGAA